MAETPIVAVLFSLEAREAVANGPVFDRWGPTPGDWGYMRQSDRCCVVGALIKAQFGKGPRTPSQRQARRVLGIRFGTPESECIGQLLDRNDSGIYKDGAKLRRDLLGNG